MRCITNIEAGHRWAAPTHARLNRYPICDAERSLKMYNRLVEMCFKECVEDMRSKALTGKEEQVGG